MGLLDDKSVVCPMKTIQKCKQTRFIDEQLLTTNYNRYEKIALNVGNPAALRFGVQ